MSTALPHAAARRDDVFAVVVEEPRVTVPWRLALAVWLLPTVADVADVYFGRQLTGPATPLWVVVVMIVPGWYVWVAFTGAIVHWNARFPIRRPLRARVVLAHTAGAITTALLHALVIATCLWAFDPRQHLHWPAQVSMAAQDWFPISLLLYAMTLGAAHALERFRAARAQERRAASLESRLARAELAVLRAQLEPHFLFNALNTAVSLVRANEGAAGIDVLTRLGDLLRHNLHGVAQETTLGDELRLLDAYVGIERARFGARLAIAMDVPCALHDTLVPSLALQALVENALRHGVGPRDGPGCVSIHARSDGACLTLSVVDDGVGLAHPGTRGARHGAPGGVGLRNVRDRLARLYGTAAALTISPGARGGVEATLRLPLRRHPHPAEAPVRPGPAT